jgi:hypothetical protein
MATVPIAGALAGAMTADRQDTDRVRYRFSPLERRGLIAGWRGGQIASVASSLVVGMLALRSRPSVVGVAVAVASLGSGLVLAFWPIHGRTGEQWLPLVFRWLWSASSGSRRQLATRPHGGHLATVMLEGSDAPGLDIRPSTAQPGHRGRRTVFDGVRVVGVPFGAAGAGGEIGMVVDGPARTATAVLAVRGHSFALLGPRDQDSRIAAWARVLSAMAREGSDVHRVQWIESCLPDDGLSVRRHWADNAVLGADSPAGRSYRTLVDEASPVTRRHRVLIGLSIHTARSARAVRSSGGGAAGTGAVLAREVLSLHRALDGADVTVDGVLGPGALARVIGDSVVPVACSGDWTDKGEHLHGRHHDGGSSEEQTSENWPWPMAMEPSWDALHTDSTWHATYWIAEWPRIDVTPDFLGPLLFSPIRRSISLVMEPMSPSRAARQVAQARTADLADGELRRRGGFLVTARHTREKESVEERDVELADGHAQYRFSGYVTVTGDTRDELAIACAAVEQATGQAGIELRLLYGAQDVAFACSLPLGRGLS